MVCKSLKMTNYISLSLLLIVVSFNISSCERGETLTPFGVSENLLLKVIKSLNDSGVEERAGRTRRTLTGDAADCADLYAKGITTSGMYHIWPPLMDSIDVYCDMTTNGGGWTVIQRRGDFEREDDYFNKNWEEYKAGFGQLRKDFWLGNEVIHALTNRIANSVRFDMKFDPNRNVHAEYDNFKIEEESHDYKLDISGYSGNAGNAMEHLHGSKFSTKDRDNDSWGGGSCATRYSSGWWFHSCANGHLNGKYNAGVNGSWWLHNGNWEIVHEAEIKIRPKNFP